MTTINIKAARALFRRLAQAKGPNIHLDIDLWVRLGHAERRDREWSDRLPVDPGARCNGLEMGEAIAAGWPAADIRTTWKVPALTGSIDAITAMIGYVLPETAWGISVEPPTPHGALTYHAFVREHFPTKPPGRWDGVSSYREGAALALCTALLRALIARAETGAET